MRSIEEIIEELQSHPDYIAGEIFTIDNVLDDLNDQLINQSEQHINHEDLIKFEDLSKDDIEYIYRYISDFLESLYDNCDGGVYPYLDQMPDIHKKMIRNLSILNILGK